MHRSLRPVLLICVLLHASFAHANWPHLRGPNFDGVSTERDLADTWPAEGPPRLWSRELGQGYSGFIVADGRLYTQRQTLGGQYLLCLDPETGATIWEHRYDWAWQPKGAYPGPYATPTAYRGHIFFASTSGIVGCVDAKTGTPVWAVNVRERFTPKGLSFGYAATPLVEDDKVIVPVGGPDGSLVALHVADGRTVWSVGSDPASYCPALPLTIGGRRCVIGYLENVFILVELASGKLLSRQPLSSGYDEHSAWPIWREPHLLLTAPFRVPATRLELNLVDGNIACKTQWLSKELCNDVASSVLFEKHVYGFDLKQLQSSRHRPSRGVFRCVAWDTGKTAWSTEEVGHASLVVGDGKLFLLCDNGWLIGAHADPSAYRELGRVQLFPDEICWTPPTLWRGMLFVRSPTTAICLHVGRARPTLKAIAVAEAPRWRAPDSSWLVTRERDFPNDAPTGHEMLLWFASSVAILACAGVIALAGSRFVRPALLFFPHAILLGILGPNVFSAVADQLIFTWPVSLYALFHAAMTIGCWAEAQPERPRAPWLARLAFVGFAMTLWAYFELCTRAGMFVVWCFLVGFPFAFPFTLLATRAAVKDRPWWLIAFWTLLAFAAFFWSAEVLLLWKSGEVDS